ncbi:hypothetical protein H112_08814 [Trichophyton rubrum D6]|nr:hypothetical protein H112_08814 [Trichophyton rubrum D6]
MAPRRGSRPVAMRLEATVTATVDVPSPSRWIFDVGSFDVAEPRRDSVRPGLGRYAAPEVTRALTEEMIIWEEEDDVDVGSSSGGGCG